MKRGKGSKTKRHAPASAVSLSWLTRRQVAALLRVTEAQVAAIEGYQLFPQSAADRSRRYSPEEVAGLLAGSTADGIVTAKAFTLFKRDVSLTDAVIETQQPAARINALRVEYDQMAGSLVLPPVAVQGLGAKLGQDAVKTSDTLLTAVGEQLDAHYRAGFRDGQAEAEDFGEVVDPETGTRRRVTRHGTEPMK